MAGERGKKKRGAQETHGSSTDQEVAKSPPFVSRYPKRTSRGVPPQLSSPSFGNAREVMNLNPCKSRSLKPALRYLNEAKLIPKPDPVGENSQVKLPPSCPAPPYGQHEMYQLEGTQEVPPQSQNKNGDSLPPKENDTVSHVVGAEVVQEKSIAKDMNVDYLVQVENDVVTCAEDVQEKITSNDVPGSGQCLSLNFTEFAKANRDDSDDPDEVMSAPGPSHDIVHGHRVKKEMAPLLRDIYQKYGDITVETIVPHKYISFYLEELCDVYQKLDTTKLIDLRPDDIAEMIGQLKYMESQKINARWLIKKLEEIDEAKTSLQNYRKYKDGEEKCIQDICEKQQILEKLERHVAMIQKRYNDELRAMKEKDAKANEFRKMARDIKTRVNDDLLRKPLVHGLL